MHRAPQRRQPLPHTAARHHRFDILARCQRIELGIGLALGDVEPQIGSVAARLGQRIYDEAAVIAQPRAVGICPLGIETDRMFFVLHIVYHLSVAENVTAQRTGLRDGLYLQM